MSRDQDRDSCEYVLALVRAAGLPGYKATQPGEQQSTRLVAQGEELATHELIRACQLPGYDPDRLAIRTSPVTTPKAAACGASSTVSSRSPSVNPRLSSRQFAVLSISVSGGEALTELEAKMGTSFAVDRRGTSVWVAEVSHGGSRRAFSFMGSQLPTFADLLGDLGTPSLKLSIERIDLSAFKASGEGVRDGEPPQWPDSLTKALRTGLGRSS